MSFLFRSPGRARLVAKLRELGADYAPYTELAQDVAEGRACDIPSWIVLDLLKAHAASAPTQSQNTENH